MCFFVQSPLLCSAASLSKQKEKKDNLHIKVCHQRKLVMLDRQLSLYFFFMYRFIKIEFELLRVGRFEIFCTFWPILYLIFMLCLFQKALYAEFVTFIWESDYSHEWGAISFISCRFKLESGRTLLYPLLQKMSLRTAVASTLADFFAGLSSWQVWAAQL